MREFRKRDAHNALSKVTDIKVLGEVDFNPGLELHHYLSLGEIDPELVKKYSLLGKLMNEGAQTIGGSQAREVKALAEAGDFTNCWVRIRERGEELPVEIASVREDRYDMESRVAPLEGLEAHMSGSGLLSALLVLRTRDGELATHALPTDLYIAQELPAVAEGSFPSVQ